ncbi:transposable element Tcb1 transposase [Trichonephila clavipes]|nr:transposable element Tcb1 transposase [Trichonephila clavipes]
MSYTKQSKVFKDNVIKGTLYSTPGELRQWAKLKPSSSPPPPLPYSSPNSQGNHQMARIVRHNDKSVREGYIRNDGKELEVSKELGIAQSVISRLWQRFQDDGNVSRCYSTGRPQVTTPNEDWYLAVTAKRNRPVSSATGMTVSRQTMYRRLGHIDLYARRPVRCVPLTAIHCRL